MRSALLISGGIDSLAIAYWKRPALAITIDYGQLPAAGEIRASQTICRLLEIPHTIIRIDGASLGSGDMAGTPPSKIANESDWWPYRNQFVVTVAAMWLARNPVNELMIGTVKTDRAHADGKPELISALDRVLALQEGNVRLVAPALHMTSAELVKASGIPMSMLAYGHSCHMAEFACGECRGCYRHEQVMEELGVF